MEGWTKNVFPCRHGWVHKQRGVAFFRGMKLRETTWWKMVERTLRDGRRWTDAVARSRLVYNAEQRFGQLRVVVEGLRATMNEIERKWQTGARVAFFRGMMVNWMRQCKWVCRRWEGCGGAMLAKIEETCGDRRRKYEELKQVWTQLTTDRAMTLYVYRRERQCLELRE